MRIAYLVAELWNMHCPNPDNPMSMRDCLVDMDAQFDGRRRNEPKRVSPEQMARIGTGGR